MGNVDADQNSIENQVIEPLDVAPVTPVSGQVYFDTVAEHVKVYIEA